MDVLYSRARVYDGDPVKVIGRTQEDFERLIEDLQSNPAVWFLYSSHLNIGSARNRVSQLRGRRLPNALMHIKENLDFAAKRLDDDTPVVLVRYVPPS